ncbi:cucumisin-like [Cucurbita pepo subsp. pepo]|uniref:cucumisin-like n=1 Tax=Cucurbita pepo subsp. pepo TaxID=3664 RepID=UPI000C9D7A53|nr:cucumisin-like [Cucurbita pepo subsp. pepo]
MSSLSRLLYLAFCLSLLFLGSNSEDDDRTTYIVYMGSHPKDRVSTRAHHERMLGEAIGSSFAPRSLLHSYKRSFNGFVAKLTEDEVQKVSEMKGVISVFPNGKKQLHTTRSWDFMGLSQQVSRVPSIESDIIVGVLDTGIWPESPSFLDEGYGRPPPKWKGSCEASLNFSCNNKIIGARSYRTSGSYVIGDIQGPIDSNGHGTHTASTVAGGLVRQASMLGLGTGTARGGVPSARIASYKICWSDGCPEADILAAFDDAIADGVDIISLSVGGHTPNNYFNDSIAIGAFHAMKNGILTSMSAGNDGWKPFTIRNFSPWSLSVAASTTDRRFLSKVQLGDGRSFNGVTINTFDLNGTQYPLVYAGNIPNVTAGFNGSISRFCTRNSVDRDLMKGKIVLCDHFVSPKKTIFLKGAIGIIMQDNNPKDLSSPFPLPASHLGTQEGALISSYANLTSLPTATILKSTEGKYKETPFVASFSSRGPNPITPDILKPDLSGPGVEILAAWSPLGPPSGAKEDSRQLLFNIISGTSMACPHATAVAAYVKSFHPSWSPAALKSALMTTAFPMRADLNPEAEFAYGSGHINPLSAVNPGLIYNATEIDYVRFLCGQGYSTKLVQQVSGDNSSCSRGDFDLVFDLNYPSFALSTPISTSISQVYRRRVTNVGSANSTYNAIVSGPSGLKITVNPSVLSFNALGEELSFEVTIEGSISRGIASGSLVWDDGQHKVKSPIVVFDPNTF